MRAMPARVLVDVRPTVPTRCTSTHTPPAEKHPSTACHCTVYPGDMVEVTLHFRSPADELGPTSFTRDREHAKQRQLAAQSGQAPNRSVQVPRQVRLRDGREGYDATQAERSVVAELLGGKGRGFVLLPHESAVTDWHDADQITSVYYAEVQELVERVLPGVKVLTIGSHIIRTEEPEKYKNPTPTVFVRLIQPLLLSTP